MKKHSPLALPRVPPMQSILSSHNIFIDEDELSSFEQSELALYIKSLRDDVDKLRSYFQNKPQCSRLLMPLVIDAEQSLYQLYQILFYKRYFYYEKL